ETQRHGGPASHENATTETQRHEGPASHENATTETQRHGGLASHETPPRRHRGTEVLRLTRRHHGDTDARRPRVSRHATTETQRHGGLKSHESSCPHHERRDAWRRLVTTSSSISLYLPRANRRHPRRSRGQNQSPTGPRVLTPLGIPHPRI